MTRVIWLQRNSTLECQATSTALFKRDAGESDDEGYLAPTLLDIGMSSYIFSTLLACIEALI